MYSSSCTKHLVIITYIYSGKCYIISYHYISSGRYRSMPMKRLVDLNHGALFEDTSGLVGSAPFKLGDQVRLSVTWMLMGAKMTQVQVRQGPKNIEMNRKAIYHHTGKGFLISILHFLINILFQKKSSYYGKYHDICHSINFQQKVAL